jgi:hypothetical protein
MEVTVKKIVRNVDANSASVTFFIKHPTVDAAMTTAGLVELTETDESLVSNAWAQVIPSVTSWIQSTTSSIQGKTFLVPVVVIQTLADSSATETAPAASETASTTQ